VIVSFELQDGGIASVNPAHIAWIEEAGEHSCILHVAVGGERVEVSVTASRAQAVQAVNNEEIEMANWKLGSLSKWLQRISGVMGHQR
jgi:hypothetical protein